MTLLSFGDLTIDPIHGKSSVLRSLNFLYQIIIPPQAPLETPEIPPVVKREEREECLRTPLRCSLGSTEMLSMGDARTLVTLLEEPPPTLQSVLLFSPSVALFS